MYKQQIKVISTDPMHFLDTVQEVILRGARKKDKTYVQLTSLPFTADFEIDVVEVGDIWNDNGPSVYAIPVPRDAFKYTKEELDEFEWEKLKDICKRIGLTGRDRTVLTTQYLKATEQTV